MNVPDEAREALRAMEPELAALRAGARFEDIYEPDPNQEQHAEVIAFLVSQVKKGNERHGIPTSDDLAPPIICRKRQRTEDLDVPRP